MLDLIAAALGFGAIGYAAGAVMTKRTLGKVADLRSDELLVDYFDAEYERAAHDRCADALTCTQRKLSAIRDLLDTPRTIRKADLRDVLDGEQG